VLIFKLQDWEIVRDGIRGDEAIKYKKVDVGKLQGDTTPLYQIPKNHCWWRYRQGTLDALSHRPIPLLSLKKRCEANFMWRALGRAELGFSAFNQINL
jgi:hypothetical protein